MGHGYSPTHDVVKEYMSGREQHSAKSHESLAAIKSNTFVTTKL